MRRLLLILLLMLVAIGPASAFSHGVAAPIPVANKVFVSTDYATCNGVANDNTGFNNFNTDALAWQATHPTDLIQLTIPSGKVCLFPTVGGMSNRFTTGLKNFQIVGYGATLTDGGTGNGFALGGGPGAMNNDNTHHVRLVTVSAGATTIQVLDTSRCGLWSAGDYALTAGIDMQGFGFPINPYFYEYVQIASTANCVSTGAITLTAPLAYTYKSTWPNYSTGSAFETDQGGPATLFVVIPEWNTTQRYYGLTLSMSTNLILSAGRDITYRDVMFTNLCSVPTQNGFWTVIDSNMSGCSLEIDKLNGAVVMQNVTVGGIDFQSASANSASFTNVTASISIQGSAKTTTIANSNIALFNPGAHSYGASGPVTVSNTTLSAIGLGGASMSYINLRGTWSGGVFTIPNTSTFTAATSGTGGVIRLTVIDATGFFTGQVTSAIDPNGICTTGSQDFLITKIDNTHVELQGTTFSATCTGTIGNTPLNWAVPGANIYWGGNWTTQGPAMRVTDLTQDAHNTYIQTSLAGVLPVIPTAAAALGASISAKVFSTPSFSCSVCVGSADALDLSQPGAQGVPLWQYSKRTYTGASATPTVPVWGEMVSTSVTVTSAGANAVNFDINAHNPFNPFIQVLGSTSTSTRWGFTVNPLVASGTPRIMLPTSTSGAQSGDALSAPGSGTWLVNDQIGPRYSGTPGGSASTTIEIITNQGVVYPFAMEDADWGWLISDNDNAQWRQAM